MQQEIQKLVKGEEPSDSIKEKQPAAFMAPKPKDKATVPEESKKRKAVDEKKKEKKEAAAKAKSPYKHAEAQANLDTLVKRDGKVPKEVNHIIMKANSGQGDIK